MDKLKANLFHLPSSVAGTLLTIASVVLAITNHPFVQSLAGSNAKVAQYVAGAAGVASGILLILGVGPKTDASAK